MSLDYTSVRSLFETRLRAYCAGGSPNNDEFLIDYVTWEEDRDGLQATVIVTNWVCWEEASPESLKNLDRFLVGFLKHNANISGVCIKTRDGNVYLKTGRYYDKERAQNEHYFPKALARRTNKALQAIIDHETETMLLTADVRKFARVMNNESTPFKDFLILRQLLRMESLVVPYETYQTLRRQIDSIRMAYKNKTPGYDQMGDTSYLHTVLATPIRSIKTPQEELSRFYELSVKLSVQRLWLFLEKVCRRYKDKFSTVVINTYPSIDQYRIRAILSHTEAMEKLFESKVYKGFNTDSELLGLDLLAAFVFEKKIEQSADWCDYDPALGLEIVTTIMAGITRPLLKG